MSTPNNLTFLSDANDYCQKGSVIFDENGLIVGSPLSHEYYKIYCILTGKRSIAWIYYPFLFFSSSKQLMDIIKIGLLAESKGLRYLDLNIIMPDNEKYVIVYKDPQYESNAYLLGYLDSLDLKPKNFIERLTYTVLRQDLMEIPKKQSRGLYLFLYYQKDGLTAAMKTAYKKTNKSRDLSLSEELESKYKFVKEYDNFADFNEKLKTAQKKAGQLKKDFIGSADFKKFKDKTPIRDFVFPMEQAVKTGQITPEMTEQIKQFKEHLNKSSNKKPLK